MKIVNRDEFLLLPANTVYSLAGWTAGAPDTSVNGFFIKGDTVSGVDYYEQTIPDFDWNDTNDHFDKIKAAVDDGENLKLDVRTETRNGMFDKDQLYFVWDREDINTLIDRLKECL
ncbi:hypothetical protein Pcaca05_05140 [Pectobacterium carotovorum subsp. carotovorum]|nr:hypothetical protein Pcaca05_05140 [Pectobacterium carotovorum subsp. carotovorum]